MISHASKVMLKVIQHRLDMYMKQEMAIEQAGFTKGRGTIDQISNLRWIMERSTEYQRPIYMCFIDYSKAFDCVDHPTLWNMMEEMGVPEHMVQVIRSLYTNQEAKLRTEYGDTESFSIGKGVRQGCVLSPNLFNLYSEYIMRQANLEELDIRVKMGGRKINNLRYATLLAESKEELLQLVTSVKEKSAQAGLYLNLKKTKVMSTEEMEEFELDGENVEVVRDFVFLGAKIEDSDSCKGELSRLLALGRAAMTGLNKIWKDKDITITTKCRIVNALVFPVVLCGCESWTIRKAERRRIDSFELWCWRRLLRIPWTARRTNKSVVDEIKTTNPLEALIKKQQLSYFGHIMRSENSLEKSMMLGMGGGARKRGRPRARANIYDKLNHDEMGDPNDNYNIVETIIQDKINTHFPTRTVKFNYNKHKKTKWVTNGIIKSINFRNCMYKKLKATNPDSDKFEALKINLRTYNKIPKRNIKIAKSAYYQASFNKYKNDKKGTWSVIKEVLNKTQNTPDYPASFKLDGCVITDKINIANQFNASFSSIGTKLASQIPADKGKSFKDYLHSPVNNVNFKFKLIDIENTVNLIDGLKTKSSCGHDGLSV